MNSLKLEPSAFATVAMKSNFEEFARCQPAAVAVIDTDGTRWASGELNRMIEIFAHTWLSAGLDAGDAIAIVAPNCTEYLAAYLGGIRAGLFVVPVNWHLSETELAFLLRESEAKAVVVHERLGVSRLDAIATLMRDALRIVVGEAPGYTPLRNLQRRASPSLEERCPGRVMAFTSATTGKPKAVILPQDNAEAATQRTIRWHESLGINTGDGNVHLCSSMLYHSAPLQRAITALEMGHCVVLVDRWHPELLLELIDRYAVTTTFMVPTMFVRLLKLDEMLRNAYDTSSLRFVVHAGAPCPVEIKRRMLDWWGPVIWESYGAAEVQGTIVSAAEWLRYPGTVGRPIPGSAVKILDAEGAELPVGQVGRIYIRPYTGDRFTYMNDEEKTRRCYSGDFITVGDLGYVNEQGYLFVCDRETDLIISSGMNIYPAEIESLLIQHPLVNDCAVVGVEHAVLGEVPKAFVQTTSGAKQGPELSTELLLFLRARLSATKLPKRIEYTDRIPRDPSGKLYRRQLRS